jgi:hypothetical protein
VVKEVAIIALAAVGVAVVLAKNIPGEYKFMSAVAVASIIAVVAGAI